MRVGLDSTPEKKASSPALSPGVLKRFAQTRQKAFAVSQVSRFSHEPKKSHAGAVKLIDKGLIIKPAANLSNFDTVVRLF